MSFKDGEMVNFEKLVFKRIKLRLQNESCLEDIRAVGFDYFVDDYSRRLVTKMEFEMYERLAEEKNIEFTIERPKFFDWLLRRTKKKAINVKLKDILKDSNSIVKGQPYIEIMEMIKKL